MVDLILVPIVGALLALLYAAISASYVVKQPKGNEKMNKVAAAIKKGANAFLKREYRTVLIFGIILVIIFAIASYYDPAVVPAPTPIAFALGALLSALAGYIGMEISVRANLRTAKAAEKGLKHALNVAFKGGAVTGMAVVGLALLGFSVMFIIYQNPVVLIGFGFGASLVSLFARVGGGIYTKGADVGADLVGKAEIGIPEDDPRNPAVIADNVGDNVGDCAGMAADLFESYVITVLASMLLAFFAGLTGTALLLPLLVGGVAVVASILGTFVVKTDDKNKIWTALNNSLKVSAVLAAIGFVALTYYTGTVQYLMPLIAGIIVAVLLAEITGHYTNKNTKSVREIAIASKSGAGTNIIYGTANGMRATMYPVLVIVAAILVSYLASGVFGIALASMAMLSLTGIVVSIDSYGPITDNAGGIAEMSGMGKGVREITDPLDAVGNTTKAVTKGFAIGAAALAALSLFVAFASAAHLTSIDILNPLVISGLFIGAMIPYVFSAIVMRAVGSAASKIVEEVRRQFKTIKGLMKGTADPDYAKAVDITTKAAIASLAAPALLGILSPILVGLILGPLALAGLLAGVIVSGLVLALFLTTSGAAWDNAKKYIEEGRFGGKGSDAHKAAVVGDTVGDPFKDTAGPGINPLIKVINMVSLLIAPTIIAFSLPAFLHLAL
ncbi:MAG: sodium-translocating pyrophosphatase [Candidatus Micrarchaeales archaeon]|nr:sodium-translocating pyrophosphatase [Candidatus Micrarchaeales archaeon]